MSSGWVVCLSLALLIHFFLDAGVAEDFQESRVMQSVIDDPVIGRHLRPLPPDTMAPNPRALNPRAPNPRAPDTMAANPRAPNTTAPDRTAPDPTDDDQAHPDTAHPAVPHGLVGIFGDGVGIGVHKVKAILVRYYNFPPPSARRSWHLAHSCCLARVGEEPAVRTRSPR